MVAKTSKARRRAFFAALAATGNQTLAAERAKVSRSWVSLHRATDPAFKAEMEAAIAGAKARLDQAASVGPQAAWRTEAGEELAVRGSNGRWTQVARARLKQWTPRTEGRFLRALATNCNVKHACAEVGMSPASAYNHRYRWPDFARRWDEAIDEGYDRLSAALIRSAGAMMGDPDFEPDPAMGPVSVGAAIRILGLHRRRALGFGRAPGRQRRVRTLDELRPSILAKLEMVERAHRAEVAWEQRAARRRKPATDGGGGRG